MQTMKDGASDVADEEEVKMVNHDLLHHFF
jgi:hypothetical protein